IYTEGSRAMTTVVSTQNDSIERAIEEALGYLDIRALVAGRRVAVKPNATWASAGDTTGVTQPDTLRAVLRHIRPHEREALIVSGGSGAAETDDVFRMTGLMDVVDEEGAEFVDHNRPPF